MVPPTPRPAFLPHTVSKLFSHRRSTPPTLKDTSPTNDPLSFLPYQLSILYRLISSVYK